MISWPNDPAEWSIQRSLHFPTILLTEKKCRSSFQFVLFQRCEDGIPFGRFGPVPRCSWFFRWQHRSVNFLAVMDLPKMPLFQNAYLIGTIAYDSPPARFPCDFSALDHELRESLCNLFSTAKRAGFPWRRSPPPPQPPQDINLNAGMDRFDPPWGQRIVDITVKASTRKHAWGQKLPISGLWVRKGSIPSNWSR
jgi:hypothetical protein